MLLFRLLQTLAPYGGFFFFPYLPVAEVVDLGLLHTAITCQTTSGKSIADTKSYPFLSFTQTREIDSRRPRMNDAYDCVLQ
jgi:hypothetical protein